MQERTVFKKILINTLKIGVSASILGYLFYWTGKSDGFADLKDQPKHWLPLLGALGFALLAVITTIVRWYYLVRALNIPFSLRDAFRLGFLGYLFNFFTFGVVGGDVIKAIFLAKGIKGQRTEAAATVFVDRAIGLYALFVVASVAYLAGDVAHANVRSEADLTAIKTVCHVAIGATLVCGILGALMLLPGFTTGPLWDAMVRLPKVGSTIERLIAAVRIYRRKLPILVLAMLMSFGVHVFNTLSIFLVALGLPGDEPELSAHFVIVPISLLAGAIPLPGGLGAFEVALDFLYRGLSTIAVAERQGFVIALAYRFITLMIAAIGMGYYLAGRQQVSKMLTQAKREGDDERVETELAPPAT